MTRPVPPPGGFLLTAVVRLDFWRKDSQMVESDLSATDERKKVENSSRISHNGESESCSILLHAYGQMHAKLFFQPYGSDHDRRPRPMPFRRNCSQVARVC